MSEARRCGIRSVPWPRSSGSICCGISPLWDGSTSFSAARSPSYRARPHRAVRANGARAGGRWRTRHRSHGIAQRHQSSGICVRSSTSPKRPCSPRAERRLLWISCEGPQICIFVTRGVSTGPDAGNSRSTVRTRALCRHPVAAHPESEPLHQQTAASRADIAHPSPQSIAATSTRVSAGVASGSRIL